MQLVLALDDRSEILAEIHQRLSKRFGRSGPFALLDPVSQLVLGLIGGRTRGDVSNRAFDALLKRFGDWETVRDAPASDIREILGAVTFADIKAIRLKASLSGITEICGHLSLDCLAGMTVEDGLAWLERFPGIGRKTAAATLNFSQLRKPALVIDTHHLRILHRLGFIGCNSGPQSAYNIIMPLLSPEWTADALDDHHQLMKSLGQTLCRHRSPICHPCPLRDLCATGRAVNEPGIRNTG